MPPPPPLPHYLVNEAQTFQHTGLDFAGPLFIWAGNKESCREGADLSLHMLCDQSNTFRPCGVPSHRNLSQLFQKICGQKRIANAFGL